MSWNKLLLALIATTLVISSFSSCSSGSSKKDGKILVRVGNDEITDVDLEVLTKVNPRLKPRLATPEGRKKVLDNYVDQSLLFLESKSRGLDKSEAVRDKINLYKKIIVAQALLDEELSDKVKNYYDKNRAEFERLKASHIFITTGGKKGRSEKEALRKVEEIRENLSKGGDFGEIAKESSEDEKTKGSQGDLGYITLKDKRLERLGWNELAVVAFKLRPNEFSESVKTKEGFHIIKVTEAKKLQPYEEAERAIKFKIQSNIRGNLLTDLKQKYKVEFVAEAVPPPAKTEGEKPAK